ncbi:MAG: asparaginase [Ruminococcaceae bacterium]|nr:asparaginase [Oscillospiraceae bacterium]
MLNKKVCLIHAGGTIGMTKSERGYVTKTGYLKERLEAISDLYVNGMPDFELYEMSPLLDSSNMAVNEWNRIGSIIAELYEKYDGFVILHGTDTMAYTASSLSFMLENLDKPVIITGSQIPLCEIRSDGRDNLITSMLIAAAGKVREVCLYFGGRLLRGNRATKMSADGLMAFDSPNFPRLAEAGINIKYYPTALKKKTEKPLSFVPFSEVPIGVLKVFPGINFSLFDAVMTEKLKGVVLETFGAGNIPGDGNALLPIIRAAFSAGAVITVCSQCPVGAVSLGAYAASAELLSAGAVSGFDMTTEAAVAKLYYLFSKGFSTDEIKAKMETDIAGELTRAK